jgi:acyl dehydratase
MNRERMRWYVDGLFTAKANDGKVHTEENIHTDDEYARSQGLPGIIADGMISTNWIYGFLLDVFGPAMLRDARLSTKYIKPILENTVVVCCLRVTGISEAEKKTRLDLDVWCEDLTGNKLTVGHFTIQMTR